MELMPLCIHGDRGPAFVLPHFAQQNFTNPVALADDSHRVPLPTSHPLAPAFAGLGQNEHAVSVAVEAVAFTNCFVVSFEGEFPACKSANQHEEG